MYHILGFRFSSLLYYEMQQSKKFRHINGKGKYSLFSHSVCKQFPKDYPNFSIICLHLYFFNLSPLSDEVKFLRRCFLSIVEGHLGNNPGK